MSKSKSFSASDCKTTGVWSGQSDAGYTSARFYKMWKGEARFPMLSNVAFHSECSANALHWASSHTEDWKKTTLLTAFLSPPLKPMPIWINHHWSLWLLPDCETAQCNTMQHRYPGTVFCIFFILDLFIWGEALRECRRAECVENALFTGMHPRRSDFVWGTKSSGAVPFTTMFALLVLWWLGAALWQRRKHKTKKAQDNSRYKVSQSRDC